GWGANFIMRSINRTVATADEAWALIEEQLSSGDALRPERNVVARHFPADATARIAKEISNLLKKAKAGYDYPAISWARFTRHEPAREKFTVTPDEFANRANLVFQNVPGVRFQLFAIDDSVFLMRPAH